MSYGWLTESSFHPTKHQELPLSKSSIIQAKLHLLEEKRKLKQEIINSDNSNNTFLIAVKDDNDKTIKGVIPTNEVKERERFDKLSIKERIYGKLLTNTELTQVEREYKKKSLIDFDTKRITHSNTCKGNDSNNSNPIFFHQFDDLFIYGNNEQKDEDNEPITNYLQLKKKRDKDRYNRLQRILKIKSKII